MTLGGEEPRLTSLKTVNTLSVEAVDVERTTADEVRMYIQSWSELRVAHQLEKSVLSYPARLWHAPHIPKSLFQASECAL